RAIREAGAPPFEPPADLRCDRVDAGGVRAEWIVPAAVSRTRAILCLHGGGYVVGSPNTHRDLTQRLARAADTRVLSVDYRLPPEHPHPAPLRHPLAAHRFLPAPGPSPPPIAVARDSPRRGPPPRAPPPA